MGVTYFLLLSCLGLATTAQAQGCSRPVGGPNMILQDQHIQTFPEGARVRFACDFGYTSVGGSPVITCIAGIWSPVMLKCNRVNCGDPGEVENGHINFLEGTEFGDKIVINCSKGYRLVGKQEMVCGFRGWMGRLPACEVVICDRPPEVVHGTFSPNKEEYEYGDIVLYSCPESFTLIGSKSIRCSDAGVFDPDPPTCTKVQCEEIEIKNADWTGGSRPPYGYSAVVIFKCRPGFTMVGAGTLLCGRDSQWLPGFPECKDLENWRPFR